MSTWARNFANVAIAAALSGCVVSPADKSSGRASDPRNQRANPVVTIGEGVGAPDFVILSDAQINENHGAPMFISSLFAQGLVAVARRSVQQPCSQMCCWTKPRVALPQRRKFQSYF